MPPAKRRKTAPASEEVSEEPMHSTADTETKAPEGDHTEDTSRVADEPENTTSDASSAPLSSTGPDASSKAKDRMARFRALQARAKTSSDQNLKEAAKESQRLATDPSALTALHRRRDIAAFKLLKAETEEEGEDFERKRAWDWTAEESEKWDKRLKKKAAHRDNNAFKDYTAESSKVYKRQLQNIDPDMERYEKDKMKAIEKAAASGGLEIIEREDGELIAVDKDGSFYSTADTTNFHENKPDKAAIDRLVDDLKKADDARMRKRKERMARNGDEGDVTYINEKNKQFNQKLSRFYNKYTAEIRDSFERGTRI
ncbi:SYF2 splicing factor-domain-containing protein [Xylaria bambusicola]|uniref:SYF2 splicing factor-domain-containing protein n=1 Tax=Xylaria bambusicola TaxID=326684 RepID=UPI00200875AF|nr:SYF2 splicing factor-domain-containing protein [Xylaria bambusicola]KAI0512682.1 SYF2 splicing factor-domain-containing protein [Xylaria bambusicola]